MNLLPAVSSPPTPWPEPPLQPSALSLRTAVPLGEVPLIRPEPPCLSQHADSLREIESAGVYSNYGPMNTLLESEFIERVFGTGDCLTVCNATIGLMLAIREVVGENRPPSRRFAVMPSFTFAATAQAALWCGLTPLFCDIDPETWLPDLRQIEALLQQHAGEIAVVIPYATFGNDLDLVHYSRLASVYGVPLVVDAAASLGTLDAAGQAFGTGFPWPIVFSMHATKVFSVGEGGLIYCADPHRMARLRSMGSFGFLQGRSAHLLGLNSKMSEVTALTARLQLRRYEGVLSRCEAVANRYREGLGPLFELQEPRGVRRARSFPAVVLTRSLAPERAGILECLRAAGVGAGCYFSPHLAEQPLFRETAFSAPLPVTEDIAARILSLPLRSSMALLEVDQVLNALFQATGVKTATGPFPFALPFAKSSSAETVEDTHTRAA